MSLAIRSASVLKDLALCFNKIQSAPRVRCLERTLSWCTFHSLKVPSPTVPSIIWQKQSASNCETLQIRIFQFMTHFQAVSLKFEPSIIMTVRTANPRLQFLVDCLQYPEEERPPVALVSRGLQQCVLEVQRENRGPAAQVSSILFPGMRVAINSSKKRRQILLDPLVKQQIEWNVKQEAGTKIMQIEYDRQMQYVRNYGTVDEYQNGMPFRKVSSAAPSWWAIATIWAGSSRASPSLR